MIAAAERTIYIENQFVTSARIARRIAARMHERPALETLIVGPQRYDTWLDAQTMRAGRIRFMRILEQAGVAGRVRLLTPCGAEGDERSAGPRVGNEGVRQCRTRG